MNDEQKLKDLCKWVKETKGITKIDIFELADYLPEYEKWLDSQIESMNGTKEQKKTIQSEGKAIDECARERHIRAMSFLETTRFEEESERNSRSLVASIMNVYADQQTASLTTENAELKRQIEEMKKRTDIVSYLKDLVDDCKTVHSDYIIDKIEDRISILENGI